jgi:hypothetical protein
MSLAIEIVVGVFLGPTVYLPLALWRALWARWPLRRLVILVAVAVALVPLSMVLPGRLLDPVLALGVWGYAAVYVLAYVEYLALAGAVCVPVFWLRWRFGKQPSRGIAGRWLRPVNTSAKKWQRHRAEAAKRREWFVGVSHTTRAPVMLGTSSRRMHTSVVGATGVIVQGWV